MQAPRTATCALDIDVFWGDDAPLYSEHLAPAQSFVLRAERLGHVPGFLLCREWLGTAQHELVSVHEGAPRTNLAVGACDDLR